MSRIDGFQKPFISATVVGPLFANRGASAYQVTEAGAHTYTVEELATGLILRDPNGAARSDVTPTAAAMIASDPASKPGDSFIFRIRNTADAAETITLTAGTGVTISGTATIAQNNTKEFLAVVDAVKDSAEAVTVYSLGTVTT